MATTELLIGQIEEVKNQALKRLVVEEKPAEETKPDTPALGQEQDDGEKRIYLICDQHAGRRSGKCASRHRPVLGQVQVCPA